MSVAARIAAAVIVAVGLCAISNASQVLDSAAVLHAVTQDYCLHGKPSNHYLNPKVARLNDDVESREMLRTLFGDADLVDSFFKLNTQTATLPKGARYACYQLSESGQYALSLPVFSKSGEDAFAYFADNCPALCGRGEMYSLHRVGRRWHVSQRRLLWVS